MLSTKKRKNIISQPFQARRSQSCIVLQVLPVASTESSVFHVFYKGLYFKAKTSNSCHVYLCGSRGVLVVKFWQFPCVLIRPTLESNCAPWPPMALAHTQPVITYKASPGCCRRGDVRYPILKRRSLAASMIVEKMDISTTFE